MLSDLFISDLSVLLMEPLRSIPSLNGLKEKNFLVLRSLSVRRLPFEKEDVAAETKRAHNDEVVSFPNEAEQWFLKQVKIIIYILSHFFYINHLSVLEGYLPLYLSLSVSFGNIFKPKPFRWANTHEMGHIMVLMNYVINCLDIFQLKRNFTSFLFESGRKILKIDPNLKRLEESVQKLDKGFLHLLDNTKQEKKEPEVDLYKTRETGSLPKNDLIGRVLMQWLRKPSNEEHQALVNGSDLYINISLLSIVGHGGMGKTTLLQHICEDEMTKEFDHKIYAGISQNE
ncbi:hypothetical protein M5K25_009822 [Dendrobium thyrsiflorum]|uniref:NB-ARC domain-containing protein n=1 Tax=Dendrobium thyrsiflorum TaxID=117978 RepID=A0ABD0VDJ3_DENTH